MIQTAESGGRTKLVGDDGHAIGAYQQHAEWMLDWWDDWMWLALRMMQQEALVRFVTKFRDGSPRPLTSARALAGEYNLGHRAADPGYDARCLKALESIGVPAEEYDTPVTR